MQIAFRISDFGIDREGRDNQKWMGNVDKMAFLAGSPGLIARLRSRRSRGQMDLCVFVTPVVKN